MAQYIGDYLKLGTIEAIDATLRERGTGMDSPNAQAAAIACVVLATRQIESTLVKLDEAATRLQWVAVGLGVVALIVSIVGVIVAV